MTSYLAQSIMPALGKVLVSLESVEISFVGAGDGDELNYKNWNCF